MPHGLLLIDKPAGVTSAQALAPVKARFGRGTKVGHAGTLDPFATGLLLVLVGDATRLSELAMGLPKTYLATVRFGRRTDTLDPEGEVVEERDPGAAAPAGLAAAVRAQVGEIEQAPPVFSALKVDGRRAYRVARSGGTPDLAPRRVRVDGIDVRRTAWPEVDLEIRCGRGTYVRAIARDLGEALGLPASLAALRRTAVGPFRADDAKDDLLHPRRLLEAAGIPLHAVDAEAARRFAAGGAIDFAGRCGIVTGDLLVGIGRDGRPETVFASARRRLEEGA